jgi:hypothetical protein
VRGTRIEDMLRFKSDPPRTDSAKVALIQSYVDFFPIENPTPVWWNSFSVFFRGLIPMDVAHAWERFLARIRNHKPELTHRMHQLQELYGEEPDYESDCPEQDRLEFLPSFFNLEMISDRVVVNEWMRYKLGRSLYDPSIIIRVAVYQIQTHVEATGTFLDLLSEYTKSTLEARLN